MPENPMPNIRLFSRVFPGFALIGGCALSAVLFLCRPASAQSRTSAALPQFEAADVHSSPEIGYPSLVTKSP